MKENTQFILINFNDNDFSNLISIACKSLIELIEFEMTKFDDSFSSEDITEFIASSVSSLSKLFDKIWSNQMKKEIKSNDSLYEYLKQNISIKTDLNEIKNDLIESVYEKDAFKDLFPDDADYYSFKHYLEFDESNFNLIPKIIWNNQESILIRICLGSTPIRSQFVVF